jgi:hypothetical protein
MRKGGLVHRLHDPIRLLLRELAKDRRRGARPLKILLDVGQWTDGCSMHVVFSGWRKAL